MGSNNALDMGQVKKFYYDTWGTIRDSNPDTALVIHDAFQDPRDYWNGFMSSGVNNVILDTHQYQVFSNDQVAMSPCDHLKKARGLASKIKSTDKWTVVGEWSGALTDCTQWLNGKGKGARYDGTFEDSYKVGSCDGKYRGTVADLSADDKKNIRSFIEAQLDAYEAHTGWFYWTWKAESAPEWNMKAQIEGGLFPQPLSDRKNPLNC
jgi:glucan 1,3-beta-glucosidase